MLNKFRVLLQPVIELLGNSFASLGLSANFWTVAGMLSSIVSALLYASAVPSIGLMQFNATILGGIVLLISGFFDIVDGNVARVTKRTSKKGSFLDSSLDKLSEVAVFLGLTIGHLAEPLLCMIALSLSLIVSYIRAKAESLGIELKGIGIGERAERLLILAIIGMIPIPGSMQWAVVIVSIIAGITIVQRMVATYKKL
ncbi:MAG TPA: CDP-alcohol phosphatidyltransferase family protein [Nitrososphaeraceae archaeon]|nr:CDP-alcohol phosphatidyltransferase family protein [Nitrososphaeraceae archaeon]